MMLIGYTNYMMLGVLVMCVKYTSILITVRKTTFPEKIENKTQMASMMLLYYKVQHFYEENLFF